MRAWSEVAQRADSIANRSPHLLRSVPPLAHESLVSTLRRAASRLRETVNLPLPAENRMAHYRHLERGEEYTGQTITL
jgi:hypothetical protein